MSDDIGKQTVGSRIQRYRSDRGISLSQLARDADVSKSYLSALENAAEDDHAKRPSGETLYAIAEALGVTMSDLLGRRLLVKHSTEVTASLREFAEREGLSQADVQMLAAIKWRGEVPRSSERWEYIYRAIVMSRPLDE